MVSTQMKHCIPTTKQTKPLFGSGVEKTLPYILSDTFVFKAKKNGYIESIDEKNEIAILRYNDGTSDIIDLSESLAKNSGGGFYISNKKELLLKENQKFVANQILAKNPQYFLGDGKTDDISYTMGKLCKVAITSSDSTYEDSCIVSHSLSSDMSSFITMKKEITLGTNANVDFLVKKGDTVKSGDPIVIFENAFEDSSINDLLNSLGDEFSEVISDLSKNRLASKYTGRIVDVQIYYNRDLEEFSPSLQKIIKDYIKTNKSKRKAISDNIQSLDHSSIKLPILDKQEGNRISGSVVDGIKIEVYIEYEDQLARGDKIAFYAATKAVISLVTKEGESPFSESDSNEEIQAIVSPLSIVSRMCVDIYNALFLNKFLVYLKKKALDMYFK